MGWEAEYLLHLRWITHFLTNGYWIYVFFYIHFSTNVHFNGVRKLAPWRIKLGYWIYVVHERLFQRHSVLFKVWILLVLKWCYFFGFGIIAITKGRFTIICAFSKKVSYISAAIHFHGDIWEMYCSFTVVPVKCNGVAACIQKIRKI